MFVLPFLSFEMLVLQHLLDAVAIPHMSCLVLQDVELAERHVSLRDPAAGEFVMVPSNDGFDLEHVSQEADVHTPVLLEPAGQPR